MFLAMRCDAIQAIWKGGSISCYHGEMHFSAASVACDSVTIWPFTLILIFHLVNFDWLTEYKHFTYDSFSEGEVEDDERPEEASTSAKEPMAPGKWNISTRQNLE